MLQTSSLSSRNWKQSLQTLNLLLCIFNVFRVYDSRSYERFLVVVAVARAKPEKSTPKCDPDPCLCDAGAVLYKLSNQANWEL